MSINKHIIDILGLNIADIIQEYLQISQEQVKLNHKETQERLRILFIFFPGSIYPNFTICNYLKKFHF